MNNFFLLLPLSCLLELSQQYLQGLSGPWGAGLQAGHFASCLTRHLPSDLQSQRHCRALVCRRQNPMGTEKAESILVLMTFCWGSKAHTKSNSTSPPSEIRLTGKLSETLLIARSESSIMSGKLQYLFLLFVSVSWKKEMLGPKTPSSLTLSLFFFHILFFCVLSLNLLEKSLPFLSTLCENFRSNHHSYKGYTDWKLTKPR